MFNRNENKSSSRIKYIIKKSDIRLGPTGNLKETRTEAN